MRRYNSSHQARSRNKGSPPRSSIPGSVPLLSLPHKPGQEDLLMPRVPSGARHSTWQPHNQSSRAMCGREGGRPRKEPVCWIAAVPRPPGLTVDQQALPNPVPASARPAPLRAGAEGQHEPGPQDCTRIAKLQPTVQPETPLLAPMAWGPQARRSTCSLEAQACWGQGWETRKPLYHMHGSGRHDYPV